ncbi:hypothetical protein Tco_0536485 [Tanacetum coccineum]
MSSLMDSVLRRSSHIGKTLTFIMVLYLFLMVTSRTGSSGEPLNLCHVTVILFAHNHLLLVNGLSLPVWLPTIPGIGLNPLQLKALRVPVSLKKFRRLLLVGIVQLLEILAGVHVFCISYPSNLVWITVFLRNGLRLRSKLVWRSLCLLCLVFATWSCGRRCMYDGRIRSLRFWSAWIVNGQTACDMEMCLFLSLLDNVTTLDLLVEVVEEIEHSLALVKLQLFLFLIATTGGMFSAACNSCNEYALGAYMDLHVHFLQIFTIRFSVKFSCLALRLPPFGSTLWSDSVVHRVLLGRRCGQVHLHGPELVQETTERIIQIKQRIQTARDRQKSYADLKRKPMEFQVGDKVMLIGSTIRLWIQLEENVILTIIVVPLEGLQSGLDDKLHFAEELWEVMDRDVEAIEAKPCPNFQGSMEL